MRAQRLVEYSEKNVEDVGDLSVAGLWIPEHTTEGFGDWGRAGRQVSNRNGNSHLVVTSVVVRAALSPGFLH